MLELVLDSYSTARFVLFADISNSTILILQTINEATVAIVAALEIVRGSLAAFPSTGAIAHPPILTKPLC
jgi:hypothetical protein